ncbi:MAG: MaoC/PaaZ C-terminal domain-containing protein [Janthinobacterium lividum]
MATVPYQPTSRGKYWDDLQIGEMFVSPRRTITEADIVNFACITGDFNAPHIDAEFCREQPYEVPIAHGPMIFSIAAGLTYQTGFAHGTVVAMLGLDSWDIFLPVKAGDTLHVRVTIHDKAPTSKGRVGIIKFFREVVNQRGEVVQSMLVRNMFLCRPAQVAA